MMMNKKIKLQEGWKDFFQQHCRLSDLAL